MRGHLADIAASLDRVRAGARQAHENLQARVALLWGTSELHNARPSVEDEARGGLAYLPSVLWAVVPRLVGEMEHAVEAHYGRRPTLPPPVVFRSWIGGDRDGNPKVLPPVTAWAQAFARGEVLPLYALELERLARVLSLSEQRVDLPDPLRMEIADALAGLEVPAALANEPFRCLCVGIRDKLAGVGAAAPAYQEVRDFLSDIGQALRGIAGAFEKRIIGRADRAGGKARAPRRVGKLVQQLLPRIGDAAALDAPDQPHIVARRGAAGASGPDSILHRRPCLGSPNGSCGTSARS